MTVDAIRAEFDSMERAEFARAYGNRRAEADTYDPVIPSPVWESSGDTGSRILDPVAFAVDVAPDRSHAAIVVAGSRDDGRTHVEVVEYRPGTGWVAQRVEELAARWGPRSVVVDNAGPAASLIPALEELDIPLDITGARDMASACGMFYDIALADQLRHIHQAPLTEALLAAQKRPLGDSWAWSRKGSTVDISPLVAATLAVWGHSTTHLRRPPTHRCSFYEELSGCVAVVASRHRRGCSYRRRDRLAISPAWTDRRRVLLCGYRRAS